MNKQNIKRVTKELISNVHIKQNANIIIFITHHTNNTYLLDEIVLNAMLPFENFKEATLLGEEKNFIQDVSSNLVPSALPKRGHSVAEERKEVLRARDNIDSNTSADSDEELAPDPLLVDIRKSARSIEIIGQILKNQHGTLERDKLKNFLGKHKALG